MLRVDQLSERQRQILDGVAAGKSNAVIADAIGMTLDGVKWHVSELLGEAGLTNRQELAQWWRHETATRVAPAFLPRRILAHPVAGSIARIAVVFAVAAAIAAGIVAIARHAQTPAVVMPARQEKLAYVQNGDIWVKTLPDGTPQRIAAGSGPSGPSWSHSGLWLTFSGPGTTWIAHADGSDRRKLDAFSAWAPTDDRYAGVDSNGAILVENADGSDRRVVVPAAKSPPGFVTEIQGIAWSPDGHWLAYGVLLQSTITTSGVPPRRSASIWRVPVDGGAPQQVYSAGDPSHDGVAVAGWTPDGKDVVMIVDPFFSASVFADGVPYYAVPATGGTPRLLVSATIFPLQPDPAGNLIAATDGSLRETWTNKRIAIIDPASGALTPLTDPGVAAIEPSWSPDGKQIAYVAAPDAAGVSGGDAAKAAMAQRKIWVIDSDGANQRQLTNDPAYRDEDPRWSADGSRILFVRLDADDKASLWLVPAAGGAPTLLVASLGPVPVPSGAPVWFGYYGLIGWSGVLDYWPATAH